MACFTERLCDDCDERPATMVNDNEGWMPDDHLCEPCAERRFDRATERAMEGPVDDTVERRHLRDAGRL